MIIFAIMGKSAVGKDTLSNKISENLGIKRVVSCTTRPKRPGETDGVEYHFITSEQMNKYIKENKILNYTSYNIDADTIWEYAYIKDEVEKNNNCIMILNPEGLRTITRHFENNKNVEIVKILIDAPMEIRIKRSLNRNGTDEKTITEIVRRAIADEQDFEYIDCNCIINTAENNAYERLEKIIRMKLGNELLEKTKKEFKNNPQKFLGGK